MGLLNLTLQQLPFLYFISVTLSWCAIHFIGEKAGVPRSLRAEAIILPVITSALKGLFPGMIASFLLTKLLGFPEPLAGLPLSVGLALSGLLLHRKMRSGLEDKRLSDYLVGGVTLLFIVSWAVAVHYLVN
ncbi:hypothetical protein LCM27_00185 [Ruegeria marisrubri]|uniref:hypothetical protein n=1 Tax=Ruegeria marisrubri TaxID=1685379 RepID=UPI001CD3D1CB|nr:hypothetical protein [Ruegeria marisrubri]MCA0904804.1 hypothetical protein [Ruegeria marisrubri]